MFNFIVAFVSVEIVQRATLLATTLHIGIMAESVLFLWVSTREQCRLFILQVSRKNCELNAIQLSTCRVCVLCAMELILANTIAIMPTL